MPSIASVLGISKDKGYRRDWRNEIDEAIRNVMLALTLTLIALLQ